MGTDLALDAPRVALILAGPARMSN